MRDILVTVLVFGMLPLILWRPWIGILVWSWLGYMNPHRQTWGFAYDATKAWQPLWPMLFVTIACGSISGWHALIGSIARPFGGWLSDRVGGAKVTLVTFLGMAVFTLTALGSPTGKTSPKPLLTTVPAHP